MFLPNQQLSKQGSPQPAQALHQPPKQGPASPCPCLGGARTCLNRHLTSSAACSRTTDAARSAGRGGQGAIKMDSRSACWLSEFGWIRVGFQFGKASKAKKPQKRPKAWGRGGDKGSTTNLNQPPKSPSLATLRADTSSLRGKSLGLSFRHVSCWLGKSQILGSRAALLLGGWAGWAGPCLGGLGRNKQSQANGPKRFPNPPETNQSNPKLREPRLKHCLKPTLKPLQSHPKPLKPQDPRGKPKQPTVSTRCTRSTSRMLG